MEPYMTTNGYHFMGPRTRPRGGGSMPFYQHPHQPQFIPVHQQGFGHHHPHQRHSATVWNPSRFRFPQNYSQLQHQQLQSSPGSGPGPGHPGGGGGGSIGPSPQLRGLGVPFYPHYHHHHPYKYVRRFEGPPQPSWNGNQYHQYHFNANHVNVNPRFPVFVGSPIRRGRSRRSFPRGRAVPKGPQHYEASYAPLQTTFLCNVKQEPQDNGYEEEVEDNFANYLYGPGMPQGGQMTQIRIKQEPDDSAYGRGDHSGAVGVGVNVNGVMAFPAITIKQEKIDIDDIEDDIDNGGVVGDLTDLVEVCAEVMSVQSITIRQEQDDLPDAAMEPTLQENNDVVAVGSKQKLPLANFRPFKKLRGEVPRNDHHIYSGGEEENHSPVNTKRRVEEYEPENPEIRSNRLDILRDHCFQINLVGPGLISSQMASCDEDGFSEAWVAVCISKYPSTLGRMVEVAGFGVWFSDENKSNFSGVLDSSRPQNQKAVIIHASAHALEAMKLAELTKVRINLETEYLNKNVIDWITKYMENPKAQSSNWDEFKYHPEILHLCTAANGMVIKWSHCSENSIKKTGLFKAKTLARKATDAWMKDLQFREEAVGSSS